MDECASTGTDEEAFPSQSQSFSEQTELNCSEAFEIEDLEDDVEIICDTTYTIPLSFTGLKFGFQVLNSTNPRPLHRRIVELRYGISLNPLFIQKQEQIEEIKRKLNEIRGLRRDENHRKEKKKEKRLERKVCRKNRNLTKLIPSSHTFSHRDEQNRKEKKTSKRDIADEGDAGTSIPFSIVIL